MKSPVLKKVKRCILLIPFCYSPAMQREAFRSGNIWFQSLLLQNCLKLCYQHRRDQTCWWKGRGRVLTGHCLLLQFCAVFGSARVLGGIRLQVFLQHLFRHIQDATPWLLCSAFQQLIANMFASVPPPFLQMGKLRPRSKETYPKRARDKTRPEPSFSEQKKKERETWNFCFVHFEIGSLQF